MIAGHFGIAIGMHASMLKMQGIPTAADNSCANLSENPAKSLVRLWPGHAKCLITASKLKTLRPAGAHLQWKTRLKILHVSLGFSERSGTGDRVTHDKIFWGLLGLLDPITVPITIAIATPFANRVICSSSWEGQKSTTPLAEEAAQGTGSFRISRQTFRKEKSTHTEEV